MKTIDYVILEESNSHELNRQVNLLIKGGWTPIGGVVVAYDNPVPSGSGYQRPHTTYAQALVYQVGFIEQIKRRVRNAGN